MRSSQTSADGQLKDQRGETESHEEEKEHPYLLSMHFLTGDSRGQMSKQDFTGGERRESRRDGKIG